MTSVSFWWRANRLRATFEWVKLNIFAPANVSRNVMAILPNNRLGYIFRILASHGHGAYLNANIVEEGVFAEYYDTVALLLTK